jgi:hypothetical protein
MTKSSVFLCLISTLSHISTSQAACDRAKLQATADAFFNSAIAKSGASTLKISPNVKIVENNVRFKSIQETSYAYISGFARPFRINAIDTQTCNVASLVVVNMTEQEPSSGKSSTNNVDCKGFGKPATSKSSKSTGKSSKSTGKGSSAGNLFGGDPTPPASSQNPWPNLISFRAQIAESSGEITEIEIVNVGTGKGGNSGTLMKSGAIPQNPGPLWSEPLQKTSGPSPGRDELIQILGTYPEGIHRHNGSIVKSAESCKRIENGQRMPYSCNSNYEGLTQNVTNRAWVVDTGTGIALGKFFFERDFSPFWIHEFFKVTDGLIQEIYAAIIPWGCSKFNDVLLE